MISSEIDSSGDPPRSDPRRVTVWDLPTRLFHWLLVGFVVTSFVTVEIGGNAMQIHELSGFVILSLLLFRVGWGFFGSRPSRFSDFVHGPKAVLSYVRGLLRNDTPPHFGHNPLGGWSIVAMLLALFVQAGTGLFANDDIMTEGPLYSWVNKATTGHMTMNSVNSTPRRRIRRKMPDSIFIVQPPPRSAKNHTPHTMATFGTEDKPMAKTILIAQFAHETNTLAPAHHA